VTPFDDVKKGERYLGHYFVIYVLFWVVVFSTCIWTPFVFGLVLCFIVDMYYSFEVGMNLLFV